MIKKKKNVCLKDGPNGQGVQIDVGQESKSGDGNVELIWESIATILYN